MWDCTWQSPIFLEKSHFLKKEPKGPKNRFFEPLWKIDSLVFAINDLKWWFLWLPNFPLHDKQVEILFWGLPATVKLEELNFWHQLEITFFWKYSDGIKLYIYSNDKVTFGVKSCVYIYTLTTKIEGLVLEKTWRYKMK